MTTDTLTTVEIPTGSWTVDPVHSVADFAVRHMMVGTFRGQFTDIQATLSDGKLVGRIKVESLAIKDEKLRGHLLSPEFFDAERYPEMVYESSTLDVRDGKLTSTGVLTVKGRSVDVTSDGRLAGPAVTFGDVEKIGLDLRTTVAREAIGLAWNAPLPQGGFALGQDVTITVTLELTPAES